MDETSCFFVSDLHGHLDRYEKLFGKVEEERPAALLLGGDLLPSVPTTGDFTGEGGDFVHDFLLERVARLRRTLGTTAPEIFLILGNDDGRLAEAAVIEGEAQGLWIYLHGRRARLGRRPVYGYAFVPPTPFLLKDWERYDVSRYVDPGCVSPEEGYRSVPEAPEETRWSTIAKDLERLAGEDDLREAVFLFHTPPYNCALDRAGLDGRLHEGVSVDLHVGSIAVRRFLESRGPKVSLHGHVHEAPRLTGTWKVHVGRTVALSAAHDGPELSLIRFDPAHPEAATRQLL